MNESATPSLVVSAAQFRADMPEFADPAAYKDVMINRLSGVAQNQLDAARWADMYQQGIEWWVAHFLALSRRNGMGGAAPGTSGLALSKTVGKASVDYDTTATTIKDGGPWNLTTYGTQLLWWARLVGIGGFQVTGDMTRRIYQEINVDPQQYGFIGML